MHACQNRMLQDIELIDTSAAAWWSADDGPAHLMTDKAELPAQKAARGRRKGRKRPTSDCAAWLTIALIACKAHLPIQTAAAQFGIGLTKASSPLPLGERRLRI